MIVDISLICLASLLAIPIAWLAVEIVSGALVPSRDSASAVGRACGLIAVLIPAHNESTGLQPTIADIRPQLRDGDRILVVADNCADDTAQVAASAGAEVVERNDLSRIGKGFALDWGVRHFSKDPPDTVVIIDADCRVSSNLLERLGTICAATGRPVQALDLMTAGDNPAINHQVAEFAWRLKNWARPLGLRALGLPCQLMGTGMAFPWKLISSAKLASAEVVEDLRLGLDLALAGSPPIFCPEAAVTSQFPTSRDAATAQRQRWEQGHLALILNSVPRMVIIALLRRNLPLLALALDLAVPPLVVLGLLTIAGIVVTGAAFSLGYSVAAFIISVCSFVALIGAVFIAWLGYGRDVLPPRAFSAVICFILAKFGLYRRMASGNPLPWVRTDRNRR